jgi:hypothetical protein
MSLLSKLPAIPVVHEEANLIYLHLSSAPALHSALVLIRCFAQPEIVRIPPRNPHRHARRPTLSRARNWRRGTVGQGTVKFRSHIGDDDDVPSRELAQDGDGPKEKSEDDEEDEETAERESDLGEAEARARVGSGFRIWRAVELRILEARWLGTSQSALASNNSHGSSANSADDPPASRPGTLPHSYSDLASSRNSRGSAESRDRERSFDESTGALFGSPSADRERDKEKSGMAGGSSAAGFDAFCEIILEDQVVARTAVRRGNQSPLWRESFMFKCVPTFSLLLRQRVLIKDIVISVLLAIRSGSQSTKLVLRVRSSWALSTYPCLPSGEERLLKNGFLSSPAIQR